MTVRRFRSLLLVLLGACLFAGCSIEGRVEVVSPSVLTVDLTVRAERSPYCNGDFAGLTVTPGNEPGGIVSSCRYFGTMNPLTLEGAYVVIASAGEHTAVVLNPYAGGQGMIGNEVESLAVTLVLPGDVVEHTSGVAGGRELRLTDPKLFDVPGGLRVVALNHAGPPYWLWWTGAGLVGGLLVGLAAAGLIQRRRMARRAGATADRAAGSDPEATAHATEGGPEQQEDDAGDALAPDPSVWSRPEQPPASSEVRDTSEPSRWAPPD